MLLKIDLDNKVMKFIKISALGFVAVTIFASCGNGSQRLDVCQLGDAVVRVAPGSDAAEAKPLVVLPLESVAPDSSKLSYTVAADGAVTISNGRSTFTDSGLRRRTADGRTVIEIVTDSRAPLYGAGERGHSIDLRGDTLVMYNRQNYGYTGSDPRISQMNITMPLLVSADGFAIVFDDFAPAELIAGDTIRYISENPEPVSYYVVGTGESPAETIEQLSRLTGRQDLPPFWSLGYITSKYGYRTQAQTIGTIDTLKRRNYPVDGIVLDLYWYGKEQDMGRLAWEPEQWPDPEGMLAGLRDKGVNLTAISQPYVLRNGRAIDNYNELAPKGMFVADSTGGPLEVKIWVGEGSMFDVSNPETRSWLRDRYKKLTDMGVGAWWGDLGEPEVHPESGIHANGLSARQYHNMYGNDWSSIIYDLFKEEYPDRRLMCLMRGGTTGLQRYSVFPWSTDVSRSWGGLKPQVRIMLNSGLSGLGYMSHDVGGFAVDEASPYMPELYVRWLELGLFSPVLRTHAQQFAEPYNYPQYENIIRGLIRERYRWLPYNYTLAWENATKSWPLVRPLNFHAPAGSPAYADIDDEFLWGCDILVAPVMTEGAVSRSVTFPEGSVWIDYRRPAIVYQGGSTIEDYPAPLGTTPLFVRAGAFIPSADYPMENTGDYNPGRLSVGYYPRTGVDSEYTLYDDNRLSPASLEKNEYRLLKFRGSMAEDSSLTSVEITSEGSYPGAPEAIDLDLTVYSIPSGNVTGSVSGCDNASVDVDTSKGNAIVHLRYVPGTTVRVDLRLQAGFRR